MILNLLTLIRKFLIDLSPDLLIQSPSRINLINPLDAVEADLWMPSVTINGVNNPLSVFCYIKKTEKKSTLKIYKYEKSIKKIRLINEEPIKKEVNSIKEEFSNENKLFYATLLRFLKTNTNFRKKFKKSKLEIGLLSTIPRQSGLGGSASIIIAILFSFSYYFDLINKSNNYTKKNLPINRDIIAEMATLIEDRDLNITAGYGDRYSICRGGLSFCSYQGKLYHKDISKEPLAIYDRIDKTYNIDKIPIIVCYSGVLHDSGNVHNKLREIYLKGDKFILDKYNEIGEISWKSRFALMTKDWKLLGNYFRKNTVIMNEIMEYAGFEYGIGLANNILIKLIENQKNVYSVKLTGAGGGGSVFALVNPEKIDEIIELWYKRYLLFKSGKITLEYDFKDLDKKIFEQMEVEFFKVRIDKQGVKKIY